MPQYFACIGVYVRTYAKLSFEAESDDKALPTLIEKFKADPDDLVFEDTDCNNMAMPTVVELVNEESNKEIAVNHDFPLTPRDSHDFASDVLLEALQALTEHSAKVNYAFYVEGKAKAMQAAMMGQKELLQKARAAIAKATAA